MYNEDTNMLTIDCVASGDQIITSVSYIVNEGEIMTGKLPVFSPRKLKTLSFSIASLRNICNLQA